METDDQQWIGSFSDYLNMVEQRPRLAQSAHARIYNMIISHGLEERGDHRIYSLFEPHFFGLEAVIEQLVVDYFQSAALGLDVRKRILLLVGPTASGKSSLVRVIKSGLAEYSKTTEGALYGILGCPMQEEPLHLLNREERKLFYKKTGVQMNGQLCPVCQQRFRLDHDEAKMVIPVKRIILDESTRSGIGTFCPSDPKSQEISELTGGIDFAKLGEYGSESDPRAFRFDGELNIANRGLMEFQEILKCEQQFLWQLLSLTEEGQFKTGRYAMISADECVLAHCNREEFITFASQPDHAALLSRMMVIAVPYTLSIHAEAQIYKQQLLPVSRSKHKEWGPHSIETAAAFAVMTRHQEHTRDDAFNTEENQDIQGMSGIDPRFVQDRLASVWVRSSDDLINAGQVLNSLRKGLQQNLGLPEERKSFYLKKLLEAEIWWRHREEMDVHQALIAGDEKVIQQGWNRMLEAIQLWEQARNAESEERHDIAVLARAEQWLLQVEEAIGLDSGGEVASSAGYILRTELLTLWKRAKHRGVPFVYDDHPDLGSVLCRVLWQLGIEGDVRSARHKTETKLRDVGYSLQAACQSVDRIFTLWGMS